MNSERTTNSPPGLEQTRGDSNAGTAPREDSLQISAPSIALPKGGGAIRSIGEKFATNPATGTGSMTVPLGFSPGRAGLTPQLALTYDSGSGNGPFGIGWSLSLPAIARKTDKGLPTYRDGDESDVFMLSGAEDLVPSLEEVAPGEWQDEAVPPRTVDGNTYSIRRYRPRIEAPFARIERWTNLADPADTFWRSIANNNVTNWYGKTSESRIADPADPQKIFRWLICETYDDKGNAMRYRYVAEDSTHVDESQAHEANRTDSSRSANRYLKRLQYGNAPSRLIEPDLEQMQWAFEMVFDYGEGHYRDLAPDPQVPETEQLLRAQSALEPAQQGWPVRPDPFSEHRAGFEVRTYRRCQRALMFHRFPELGTEPVLVRATEFHYDDLDYTASPPARDALAHPGSTRFASRLKSVTQSGHVHYTRQPVTAGDVVVADGARWVTTIRKSLSPLEFDYSQATLQDELHSIDATDLDNLPAGLDGARYRWVDLDGEGAGGILTEQGGAWFYKRNLSPLPLDDDNPAQPAVRFAPLERVAKQPSLVELTNGQSQFLDLAGDGQVDVAQFEGPVPGFFERDSDGGWSHFRNFALLPNINWNDVNLRFVDLTGDGHVDVLVTEDDAFTWYASLAEEGFAEGVEVSQALEEEKGPRLIFAEGAQSIHLADLSGDGLSDLVRIRNGEVCYWPNLGYGRFGAKVTMDNAPVFDAPDQFDPLRIRLADIDGSGVTDILYIRRGGVRLYLNESGNRWTDAEILTHFPKVDDLSSVVVVDLLGNGTACLVWSSGLPSATGQPLRYVDLMGGQKPHLLVKSMNGLGVETRVHYAPSTRFYLQDKLAGRPWATRLHFPVHVVERVETFDHVSKNRFVSRYAYHHGCYDGAEREFRGFGMVEQFDTEEFSSLNVDGEFSGNGNIDSASHVPPVMTRSWFHTGTWRRDARISRQYKDEYYREPGLTDAEFDARLLPDTVLPPGLSAEEQRQAVRALRGTLLREELYALDGTDREAHPYAVTEQNAGVRLLQPQAGNRHAVFLTHQLESVKFHYERNPEDPRLEHAIALEVDDFGNTLKTVNIVYGRRLPGSDPQLTQDDHQEQAKAHIQYSETDFTNAVNEADDYRTPRRWQSRDYELTGYTLVPGAIRFGAGDFVTPDLSPNLLYDEEIPYEASASTGRQRRLIENSRTRFRSDDLTQLLPYGVIEALGLPGESCRLAFTPGLFAGIYPASGFLPDPATVMSGVGTDQGGYVDLDNDGHWWVPSGQSFFDSQANPGNPAQTAAQELATARDRFFLPHLFVDPLNSATIVEYDSHALAVTRTQDAVGNEILAEIDYRVLQTSATVDPNGNRSEAAFDALGLLTATAVLGTGQESGDGLQSLSLDLTEQQVQDILQDPLAQSAWALGDATGRMVYDVERFHQTGQPGVAVHFLRERHGNAPEGEPSPVQVALNYSDGFGREIQSKTQAEPGTLESGGPVVDPRWLGSGWIIFNNKGKPVRRYEPFFSATHDFEFAHAVGVSPVILYDPLSRPVVVLHPDRRWEKTVFDSWRQEIWDGNDTVLLDPLWDEHAGQYFARLPADEVVPTWYDQRIGGGMGTEQQQNAAKTTLHSTTPGVAHLDSLGRTFLTVAFNRFERNNSTIEERYRTRQRLDIEGNAREVIDALDRKAMVYETNLLGGVIRQGSMDSGERWLLQDVTGNPIRAWDSRGHRFRNTYDALRRPLNFFAEASGNAGDPDLLNQEILYQQFEYGEGQPNAAQRNLRGRVFRNSDPAGVMTHEAFDFKGNLIESSRQLAANYKTAIDWSAPVALEPETQTRSVRYDALGRVVESTSPDGSVFLPRYNEANLLDSVAIRIRGANDATDLIENLNYNAKGQREWVEYGNGVTTRFDYDPQTFRLTRVLTLRGSEVLQDLRYLYDPAGNITRLRDDAQQTVYFDNVPADPHRDYVYDAIYRLVRAEGREHRGQQSAPQSSWDDAPRINPANPRDGQAMGTYSEVYEYDAVGNILRLAHQTGSATGNWTRESTYTHLSAIDPGETCNHLSSTSVGGSTETFSHDLHGNLLSLQHLNGMQWNYLDRLRSVNLGGGGMAYYVYDVDGTRVRKVIERQNASRQKERVYLGDFEIYREYAGDGTTITLERETLHGMDNDKRLAIIETRTQGDDGSAQQLIRYQLGNHLGSSTLELDTAGGVVSYEEYTPYGSTAYQAVRDQTEVPQKRYRFSGKERDDETGLGYHGARYYASWLARWVSADPEGLVDGVNLYAYVRGSPVVLHDPTGTQALDPTGLADIGVSPAEWRKLVEKRNMWQKELTQWEKRASEINNTYKRGSAEWQEKMNYVKPRIAQSRRELAAVKKRMATIDEARRVRQFTKQFIANGGFLQNPSGGSKPAGKTESTGGTTTTQAAAGSDVELADSQRFAWEREKIYNPEHRDAAWVQNVLDQYRRDMNSAFDQQWLMLNRHGANSTYDFHFHPEYWDDTFEVPGVGVLKADEFGNFIAGYGAGASDDPVNNLAHVRDAGSAFGLWNEIWGDSNDAEWKYLGDNAISVRRITQGFFAGQTDKASDSVPVMTKKIGDQTMVVHHPTGELGLLDRFFLWAIE